jgi:AbrB family looped-hinge helix DNA binding protein
MNVGTYVQPTARGQVVIPVDYREKLGINENTLLLVKIYAGALYLQPVTPVAKIPSSKELFLEFLAKNRGAWGPETPAEKKLAKKRRAKELARAEMLRNAW